MITHCRSMLEKCSACWAEGSAMFTIVASSTTISWASATTARISQRLGSAVVPGVAAFASPACRVLIWISLGTTCLL